MKTVTNAAEAYLQYQEFLDAGALKQGVYISADADGREIACALGIVNIRSPSACPAKVMPRWLAQMVPWFFDNQSPKDAFAWGAKFYEQLARLDGNIPFSVIHDWHANIVGKIAQESAEKHGRDVSVHKALAEMQWKALTGEKFTAEDWHPILKAAFLDVYKRRYPYAYAYADAYAYANAYADANPDAYAYANANANPNANAYANAYAYADANPNPNAYANAYADAYRRQIKALADGMVECLARA